jgi:Tfp pilus assembly protein PilN
MIQFNLLPDVKQEFVKARRTKRLVTLTSIGVSGLAVFILLLMLVTVDVVQKKSMHDLNSDIAKYSSQLKAAPDLNKMLTVQNQLNTLTDLHDKKVVTSRLFGYISQITPAQATISNLSVDFTANTVTLTGEAPSIAVVNAYTDTLKATTYTTDTDGSHATQAFSDVVLASFGRDSKGATYNITFTFDPVIFSSGNNVKLSVPSTTGGAQQLLFQKQAGS